MEKFVDEKKIETIIRQHADMIYRIALQNVKSKADAEDIFQEVCLSLITGNAPIDDALHIRNWLIRVTINKCNNFHKSFWNRNSEPLTETLEYFPPEQQELISEIWKLPKNYRNIIYLYYYEGYKIAEIAELMNLNPNTVSSSLNRARRRLKIILTEGGFNYG